MKQRMAERVVVVTGASSGIGRQTALHLARQGATVVVAARREEPLESLKQECEALGGRCLVVPTDVSQVNEVDALAEAAAAQFGRIDGWVNNAAVFAMGSLEETPLDAYRQVMDTNFLGVVYGTRAAVRHMKRQGRGVIVNISSEAGSVGVANASAYVASKHAVRGFSDSVRQELLGTGIDVCTVMPVGIDTPLFAHAANYTGWALKPPEPVYPPERVARKIVRLLRKPTAETYVGLNGPVFGLFRHASPKGFDRMMRVMSEQGHFKNERVPRTDGNLTHPIEEGTGVHGGWHGKTRLWLRRLAFWSAVGFGAYRLRGQLART